jgi:predicted ATP-dependent endonuclease of OLD family
VSKNNQIILVTHSPFFVDLDADIKVIRIASNGNKSSVHAAVNISSNERATKTLVKNLMLRQALFSNAVVVCEGDTEYWVTQICLPKAF